MNRRIASRMSAISPSLTLAITAKAKAMKAAGEPVVSFGVGEPGFQHPEKYHRRGEGRSRQGLYEIHPLLGASAFEEGDLRKI